MAFNSIPDAWIQVAQAITQRLWQRAKDNFDALFSTIGTLQGSDILNGFFEVVEDITASPILPASWDIALYLGGSAQLDDTRSVKGTYGMTFFHPGGAGNGGGEALSDYMPIDKFLYNRLQTIYKSTGATVHLIININYFDEGKLFLSSETLIDLSGGVPTVDTVGSWTLTVPASARFFKVLLVGGFTDVDPGANTAITFDDVKLNTHISSSVNENILAASAVSRGKLKTSTEDVTAVASALTLAFAAAADYGFFPRIKTNNAGSPSELFSLPASTTSTAFVTIIHLNNTTQTGTARMRYVTASGDVFWIWILRDKVTKDMIIIQTAPDHPAMATGDPETMAHPFLDYDENIHEIICITSSKKNGKYGKFIEDMHKEARLSRRAISDIVYEDYEIDEISDPSWPDDDVTVGYDIEDGDDLMDLYHSGSQKEIKLKKVKIPKPSYIIHKGLRKKVTA